VASEIRKLQRIIQEANFSIGYIIDNAVLQFRNQVEDS